ncbi:MAG: class I SAM-dependent methyltransferase [Pseudomonadota bacterium]
MGTPPDAERAARPATRPPLRGPLGGLPFTGYGFQGTHVACPVCGEDQPRVVATVDRYLKRLRTVMCGHCGLLYCDPMPSEADLARYYAHDYRAQYQFARSGPRERHRRKRRDEARERASFWPDIVTPGKRALDFGCGSGEMVEVLTDLGLDAHGFDPGEAYARDGETRLGARIKIARWQDVTYDRPFDLITCFHVLEHLRDPLGALVRMRSLVADDGHVMLEVPDSETDARKGIASFHLAHTVGFNGANLTLAAALAGFRVVASHWSTSILLTPGTVADLDALAEDGRHLTRAGYVDQSPFRRYLSYRTQRLFGGR